MSVCLECNESASYGLSMLNQSICASCNLSCSCDGYGLPFDYQIEECTPIYGDSLIRLIEECDDGNTIDGDGCSALSQIEPFYYCFG